MGYNNCKKSGKWLWTCDICGTQKKLKKLGMPKGWIWVEPLGSDDELNWDYDEGSACAECVRLRRKYYIRDKKGKGSEPSDERASKRL